MLSTFVVNALMSDFVIVGAMPDTPHLRFVNMDSLVKEPFYDFVALNLLVRRGRKKCGVGEKNMLNPSLLALHTL